MHNYKTSHVFIFFIIHLVTPLFGRSLPMPAYSCLTMPFVPPASLDDERLQTAVELLCVTFGVPSLRPHQLQTGKNILLGYDTILDAPTGAGKTLAFYLPLFYYWSPGIAIPSSQKVILVISPLVELMKSQVGDLSSPSLHFT